MKNKKYHTVGTVLKYHTVGTVLKNHHYFTMFVCLFDVWPVTNHWQTLSQNVVHLALIEIQTHNISGESHQWAVIKR
jgi:hypothetical protein